LLARCLERLPRCFVLKEPQLLGQLSAFRNAAFNAARPEPPRWGHWFGLAMNLFARAYPGDLATVVKAPDRCSWMGHALLQHDSRTKVAFLSSPLRIFLQHALKADHRRDWLRAHVQELKMPMAQVPFLSDIAPEGLSDGDRAASMWLLN